jgi:hypothetical protein
VAGAAHADGGMIAPGKTQPVVTISNLGPESTHVGKRRHIRQS